MNINQVKTTIAAKVSAVLNKEFNLPLLELSRQTKQDDGAEPVPSEWLSHWDNDHRVRVSMHQDVRDQIKAGSVLLGVSSVEVIPAGLKPDGVTPRLPYLKVYVTTPRIEDSF